jgi:hypothetical protein
MGWRAQIGEVALLQQNQIRGQSARCASKSLLKKGKIEMCVMHRTSLLNGEEYIEHQFNWDILGNALFHKTFG